MSTPNPLLSLGRAIIIYNLMLFLLLVLFLLVDLLFMDELALLVAILTPVTAVYLTPIVKFVATGADGHPQKPLPSGIQTFRWVIHVHFILLLALILISVFWSKLLPTSTLVTLVVIEETLFGAFVGYFIPAYFSSAPAASGAFTLDNSASGRLSKDGQGWGQQQLSAELSRIKGLISRGKTEDALHQLQQWVATDASQGDLYNQLINLSAQFEAVRSKKRIHAADANDEVNLRRIHQTLLEITDELIQDNDPSASETP